MLGYVCFVRELPFRCLVSGQSRLVPLGFEMQLRLAADLSDRGIVGTVVIRVTIFPDARDLLEHVFRLSVVTAEVPVIFLPGLESFIYGAEIDRTGNDGGVVWYVIGYGIDGFVKEQLCAFRLHNPLNNGLGTVELGSMRMGHGHSGDAVFKKNERLDAES